MIIPINDKYRLAGSEQGWALQRLELRKRCGKEVADWRPFRWYATLEQAVNDYAEFRLATADGETVAEALAQVDRIAAELCEALRPHFQATPTLREVSRD